MTQACAGLRIGLLPEFDELGELDVCEDFFVQFSSIKMCHTYFCNFPDLLHVFWLYLGTCSSQ